MNTTIRESRHLTEAIRFETIGLPKGGGSAQRERRDAMRRIANRVWFRIVSRMMAKKATRVEVNVILPIASHLIGF